MSRKTPPGFQPGNPGRPQGARNKLCNAFLVDLVADWETHGKGAIEIMRKEHPDSYVKVVASVLPKALNVTTKQELESYSDDELVSVIQAMRDRLGEQERTH